MKCWKNASVETGRTARSEPVLISLSPLHMSSAEKPITDHFPLTGAWATYNTVRYYVGAWLHPYRQRQVIALVLGSCTALCLACTVTSVIISASAPHLGWYYRPHSKHILLQGFLRYSSSILLFAPAFVNFILVFIWRNTSDIFNNLHGRCHWDIDVVWTGFGGVCEHGPEWGFWLAGSLVRLLLTAALVVSGCLK